MNIRLSGTIIAIGNIQHINEKFSKIDYVIRIDENQQYPQEIKFQVANDKIEKFKNLLIGAKAAIECNLNGRSYIKDGNTNWINTIDAWKYVDLSLEPKEASTPATNNKPF
jgi:single-strand DNA-binding protein